VVVPPKPEPAAGGDEILQATPGVKAMKKNHLVCLVFLLLFVPSALAQNLEEVVVEAEGTYLMGDRDSKQTARELALYEAKRMALEKAGTALASSTRIENYEVVKDEILNRAAGRLKVEVLEEKWEHCDATMRVRIRIRAKVKPEYLEVDLNDRQVSDSSLQVVSHSYSTDFNQKEHFQINLSRKNDPGNAIAKIYPLIRQQQYAVAMQKIKKLQNIYPNLARLYVLEAKIFYELHRKRESIKALRHACSLGSDWACQRLKNFQHPPPILRKRRPIRQR
jgi:hypothetical protein